MSLKRKFILVFLAVFVLPFFMLGIFNHYYVRKLLQREIIQEHHFSILDKVERVKSILKSNIDDILLLRDIPVIPGILQTAQTGYDPLDRSTFQQWEKRFIPIAFKELELNENWDEIFCLDVKGREVIRIFRGSNGIQLASSTELHEREKADYFNKAFNLDPKAVYISPLSLEKDSSGLNQRYEPQGKPWTHETQQAVGNQPNQRHRRGEGEAPAALPTEGATRAPVIERPVIYFSLPVFGSAGNRLGVLGMRYRLSSLLKDLSQTSLGYIVLTDQDGYFIDHPEEQKKFSRLRGSGYNFFEEQAELKKNTSRLEFKDHHDIQDEQYRTWRKIYYDPGNTKNYWILFSVIPEKILFEPIYKFRNFSLFVGMVVLLLGGSFVWFIADKMTHPLQLLTEGAKIVGSGNLDYRIQLKQEDEIGELANAFDQMAENLQKITEAERDNRTAFQSMFEHASLGLIIVNEKGEIKEVNPYANRLFAYSDKELLGKKIEVLVPVKIREKHVEHRTHYIQKPKSRAMGIGMDLSAVKKDGTEFPVEISLAAYQIAGKKEVVSFISDITERKKAEEALKKLNAELENKVKERTKELSQALIELHHINDDLNQEMEYRKKIEQDIRDALEKEKELSELKSRFVSMASHEFRTPLAGILTSADLIARYSNVSDEEKRQRHLNTIKASVKNLTSILNDFLSLDKLEEGKVKCRPSVFRLNEFITQVLEEMQSVAKKGQKIITQYHGDEDQVFMDQGMLRNVLINLLSNAMKYSTEDSEIKLDIDLGSSQVVFKIEDPGIGIPEEDQKHLFDRFFRAQNVTAIQGTGLGLNIIKKYLDLMEGSIAFASRENKGSTFTVTLAREIKS